MDSGRGLSTYIEIVLELFVELVDDSLLLSCETCPRFLVVLLRFAGEELFLMMLTAMSSYTNTCREDVLIIGRLRASEKARTEFVYSLLDVHREGGKCARVLVFSYAAELDSFNLLKIFLSMKLPPSLPP